MPRPTPAALRSWPCLCLGCSHCVINLYSSFNVSTSRPCPSVQFSLFQALSHVRLFATPWTAAHLTFLSFTISWSLLKLMSIELMMPSNHLIFYRPLLLLPASFPMSQLFTSGGQSSGTSASASKLKLQFQLHSSSWRRQWHPTPVLLPGKYHGRRNLVGCSPWGC